ncbi:Lrp/AsnC family transcriptional regulator [Halocatena marina]|uniref:Lrp/AsnC family transcriptional regulator n=1 Tax=Halocatena marina TaxID=2934937 RepID=UPI00200FF2B8|nr:Lrp/AsnC family transcriptional regulator [Halocatena marina]
MNGNKFENFDDIDSHILKILTSDPRAPYSDIAEELKEAGYKMSSEGIRYRVSKLMEATTAFFLLDPDDLSWEIVRIAVKATNADSMKDEAFDRISEMPFWHVTRGIGTYDVYAVGMAPSMRKIDEFVTTIREFDCVENIEHIVVTERRSNLDDYYRTDTEEE